MIVIVLIWYPKCSTCQKAKRFLEEKKLSFSTRDIVLESLGEKELSEIISRSGQDIQKFFNTSGMKYREYHLKEKIPTLSEKEKIHLLASDGMLVKRPILLTDSEVLVGFREKEWSERI